MDHGCLENRRRLSIKVILVHEVVLPYVAYISSTNVSANLSFFFFFLQIMGYLNKPVDTIIDASVSVTMINERRMNVHGIRLRREIGFPIATPTDLIARQSNTT